jgi:hypothetical protein
VLFECRQSWCRSDCGIGRAECEACLAENCAAERALCPNAQY